MTDVTVYNRGDYGANRAQNLRVGVTDTMPVVGKAIDLNSYTLCAEKPGNKPPQAHLMDICWNSSYFHELT